jgi:hypothetical protein
MSLVKSKQRVADHGEVFTPLWMVEAMLDLVNGETERIDARFLEPACGSGNFLVPILRRNRGTGNAMNARPPSPCTDATRACRRPSQTSPRICPTAGDTVAVQMAQPA